MVGSWLSARQHSSCMLSSPERTWTITARYVDTCAHTLRQIYVNMNLPEVLKFPEQQFAVGSCKSESGCRCMKRLVKVRMSWT